MALETKIFQWQTSNGYEIFSRMPSESVGCSDQMQILYQLLLRFLNSDDDRVDFNVVPMDYCPFALQNPYKKIMLVICLCLGSYVANGM